MAANFLFVLGSGLISLAVTALFTIGGSKLNAGSALLTFFAGAVLAAIALIRYRSASAIIQKLRQPLQ